MIYDILAYVFVIPLIALMTCFLVGLMTGLYLEHMMDYINGQRIQAEKAKDFDRLASLNDRMSRVARWAVRLERILYLDFRG